MPVRRTVAAFALLLAACAPAAGPPAAPAPEAEPALVTSLTVEPVGDTVHLALQVTNGSSAPLVIRYDTGQAYDFAVLRGAETLWQWSQGMRFIQAQREETLAPGETRAITEHWVPGERVAGELTARAWLTSTSHPVERTATFRMP